MGTWSSPQSAAGRAGQGSFVNSLIQISSSRGHTMAVQWFRALLVALYRSTIRNPAAEASSHLVNHYFKSSENRAGRNCCLKNLPFSG